MNKHIKISVLLPLFLAALVVSCDNVNSLHQKYLDMGEKIYTGAVDSLKSQPGNGKIKLNWEINADPRIAKTIIYWNQRLDSIVIPVDRTQVDAADRTSTGGIRMSRIIEEKEGEYVFQLITRDNEGHFSMTREILSSVYGDIYISTLKNRNALSWVWQRDRTMTVKWDAIPAGTVQYVTIYGDENLTEILATVPNDATETNFDGVASSDKVYVVTTYLPVNGLETFDALPREYELPVLERYEDVIPKSGFSMIVPALPGDNTSVNGTRPLSNIWDDNPAVILHTVQNQAPFNFPHLFTFDMGITAYLYHFRIWGRIDSGTPAWEGTVTGQGNSPRLFEVWATEALKADTEFVDEDARKAYWESTVEGTGGWKDDWTMLADHEVIKPEGADTNWLQPAWHDGWPVTVIEPAQTEKVRYIRLVIKANWRTNNVVNIGEITFWGDDMVQ